MNKEQAIELAKQAGFNASVGKTDKEGNYHPYVNAIGRDVPFEWVERFYTLVRNAALEEAAQKCRDATASIWDYHEDGRKEIGTTVCNNLAAAIESLKEPTP